MTKVSFFDPAFEPDDRLIYSVICARYRGKWIFVKHHSCDTFEIPAGHIEPGESPLTAAKRELYEETGATRFTIECISTYSVIKDDYKGWGKLYFADVESLDPFPDVIEIEKIIFSEEFPPENTYPDIQPVLFRRVLDYLNDRKSIS
jgi:8-oxo-dGTP diphosphatase